jgi:hypothetical protein
MTSAAELPSFARSSNRSLRAAAAARSERLDASQSGQAVEAPPASGTDGGRSFFASRKGTVALALMAGAVAFTIYSAHHDRIHSPVR